MSKKPLSERIADRWDRFRQQESLTDEQLALFGRYADILIEWNEKMNITAVDEITRIIPYHFQDSLALKQMALRDHTVAQMLADGSMTLVDVGSGGGFPGIPLAIKYPSLPVILIEVSQKKVAFLEHVIAELNLADRVTIFDKDWLTFLRATHYNVGIVCARASLQPEDLIRMFKSVSPYHEALLMYWASKKWEPSESVVPYIVDDVSYKVGHKMRRLIAMKRVSGQT